jgi:hypothetical protein
VRWRAVTENLAKQRRNQHANGFIRHPLRELSIVHNASATNLRYAQIS